MTGFQARSSSLQGISETGEYNPRRRQLQVFFTEEENLKYSVAMH